MDDRYSATGARLKKFVRNVVSWRPYHDGWVAASRPHNADGTPAASVFVARRKYESCAMMQILRMCVAQEEMWAAPAIDSAGTGVSNLSVSERRMQTLGRTTLLKVERGKGHPSERGYRHLTRIAKNPVSPSTGVRQRHQWRVLTA